MQRKWFVLLAGLVMLSLLIAPVGIVGAQVEAQIATPDCPPFDSEFAQDQGFLKSLPPECSKSYQKLTQEGGNQADQPDITPLAVGGPDAFGYTFDDTVPYSWINATTNSGLTGDDDYSVPINIGFDFPFYGLPQTQLYFSTNGLITFGAGESWGYGGGFIPDLATPNNFIAPFWEDLVVGSPDNSGAIYYSQGGAAPNRYFVIEWRNVTTYEGSSAFSFEAILYENGDVVVQHQSLPASYYSTVGIENSAGDEGLQYQSGSSGLSAPKAIRFYYPTAPTARVLISPLEASVFSASGGTSDFVLTVTNTGSLGTDTYDLTSASSWPVSYYAMDGITSLTDTDLDGTIDTDSLSIGSSVTIIVKIAPPGGTAVGDINNAIITVRSSLNTSKLKTVSLLGAIPAPFAQVYDDYTDGAMSLDLIQPSTQVVKKATPDGYYGYDMAVAAAPNGNFVYVWTKYRNLGSAYIFEIEYTLLDHYGNTVRAVAKLTNNSGATTITGGGGAASIGDYSPSVAVTPNGAIGVIWYRKLFNAVTSQFNDNIYFATLDASGNLVTGPTNITNNGIWGTFDDLNIPNYVYPTIAATSDNRFILSWEDFREVTTELSQSDFWYATYSSTGATVFAPALLTHDHNNYVPTLNSLTNGNAILTYKDIDPSYNRRPYYMIINSSGAIVKSETSLGNGSVPWYPVDAVLLSNGKVAAAWGTKTGIGFSILDSTYTLESGPTVAVSPSSTMGWALSVTTDPSSHVIMTWPDGWAGQNLFYALGDSTGALITPPMSYKTSANYINMSWNGQGNAPYSLPDGVDGVASLSADLVGGEPGSSAAVGIHTTNHGATTATGVVLTVTLDGNLTYVSDTSGIVPSVSGNTVTWNLPNITSLGGQDFTLNVGIPAGAALGTHYPISLSLTSSATDLNSGDNTDSADVMAALLVYLPLIMR